MSLDSDNCLYSVLVNAEGQYSLWPARKPVPLGWEPVGFSGDKESCISYVDEHWTDMRPRSLTRNDSRSQPGRGLA